MRHGCRFPAFAFGLRNAWLHALLPMLSSGLLFAADSPSSARSEAHASAPTILRVLTYNVLADPAEAERRAPALLKILREAEADVIALQEVAPWFAEQLLREPWTRELHRATKDGKTFVAHEHLILSRFPVLEHFSAPLPGRQKRILFSVTLDIGGRRTAAATCHLESFLEDGPIRSRQLDAFFAHLARFDEAILLGDFNFGDGEQPDSKHLDPAFVDTWLALHPEQPGFTWNREVSPMARRGSFPGEKSRRLDRVLVKSGVWRPVAARIIGDEPVAPDRPGLYPSDHFGLIVELRRVDG